MGKIQDSIDKATKTVGEAMIISGMSEMSAQSALDSVGATDAPARNKLGAMKQSNKAHDVQKLMRETKLPQREGTLDEQTELFQQYKDLDIANKTDEAINKGLSPKDFLNFTDTSKYGNAGMDSINAGFDRYFEKENKAKGLVDKYLRYQQSMQNKQRYAEVKKAEAQASRTPKQRKKSDPNYTPVTGGMNFD